MIKVNVVWKEGSVLKEYELPVTGETIYKEVKDQIPYDIMTMLVDNRYHRLDHMITHDCKLEFLDIREKLANNIFQTSLSLLYIKAVHDVLGKNVVVTIENALSRGLYTTIRTGKIERTTAKKIENRMRRLVELNLPLERQKFTRNDAITYLTELGLMDQVEMLELLPDLERVEVYRLVDETKVYYDKLVMSTGYLQHFEVRRYKNGMLLRFPDPAAPDRIPPFEEQKLLYNAFAEEYHWNKIMGIKYASDLNQKIMAKDYKDLILLSEALHEKKIAEIAGEIHKLKKRIILIAGPSSSGKTTFTKRLIIQLRVLGLKPLYLGTDDYFVEREETPKGPDGEYNFEDLEALDIELFETQMNALLNGKKVDIPTFDFVSGKKVYGTRITALEPNQPILIEGIHGLNPELTMQIPEEEKYKIYISPLTQLNIDPINRIPTTDARMLRRIVRDHQFRGKPASGTIKGWKSVRRGEEKNIFPFNSSADCFFNSHCLYELSVLKKYAKPLLEEIKTEDEVYSDAKRMLEFLEFFVEMKDDSMIPNNSIMREFIGGSILAE